MPAEEIPKHHGVRMARQPDRRGSPVSVFLIPAPGRFTTRPFRRSQKERQTEGRQSVNCSLTNPVRVFRCPPHSPSRPERRRWCPGPAGRYAWCGPTACPTTWTACTVRRTTSVSSVSDGGPPALSSSLHCCGKWS